MNISAIKPFEYLIILILIWLPTNCAISPKYRTNRVTRSPVIVVSTESPAGLDNAPVLQTVEGTASWYGPNFHGNLTANGEIFDMNKVSAAHKDFPLGTWIRVTNKSNNRSIIVRINDRGPYIGKRILDLSKRAAELLDFVNAGLTEVKIEVLRWGGMIMIPSPENPPIIIGPKRQTAKVPCEDMQP